MQHQKSGLKILFFAVLVAVVAALPVHAQETDDVIRTETSLVQLNVGVVDKQGRPITSLTRNDFAVYEDGVKQPIQHFEPVDAPFSLVLMLDMSGSTINFRQQLKLASQRFLDALAPEDRVAVIQFNKDVKSLSGFSTDRQKTAYAIEIANGAGETHFYGALKYALRELEKEGQRRKAIVVLTDGLTVGDLVERAGGFRAPHVSYDVTIIRRSSSPEIAGPAALPFQCVATLKTTLRNGDVILINRPGPTSKESGLMKRITCDRGREPK